LAGWWPAQDALKFDPCNITQSGLEILRAQRAALFTVKDPSSGGFIAESYKRRVVHGFAQQMIIRRDCMETRLLKRRPDKTGG
jgi:hypothetical protein